MMKVMITLTILMVVATLFLSSCAKTAPEDTEVSEKDLQELETSMEDLDSLEKELEFQDLENLEQELDFG